ncbi:hypothetical protein C7974DRAFT_380805 [Boeremia exigua]|uniref:uncharacterized protein n=1 Tax=Boeremia exigua TaxID=749465 RepID=UPI001E8EF10C|nr:uncharacterized protein C7974DRAFT_380805 [Boeremia exigua]KAH6613093.1 hypothetical protein C7974DRAFT_380805 [Boeremia exigua]
MASSMCPGVTTMRIDIDDVACILPAIMIHLKRRLSSVRAFPQPHRCVMTPSPSTRWSVSHREDGEKAARLWRDIRVRSACRRDEGTTGFCECGRRGKGLGGRTWQDVAGRGRTWGARDGFVATSNARDHGLVKHTHDSALCSVVALRDNVCESMRGASVSHDFREGSAGFEREGGQLVCALFGAGSELVEEDGAVGKAGANDCGYVGELWMGSWRLAMVLNELGFVRVTGFGVS